MTEELSAEALWEEVSEVDKRALFASLFEHIAYASERKRAYIKQHSQPADESLDPDIVTALDARERAATIAISLLGGEIPKEG